MGNCKDCKHWVRGLIITAHPDAKQFGGKPMHMAGKTEVLGEWWLHKEQDSGECQKATEDGNPLFQAVCNSEGIAGNLLTAAEFGCSLFNPAPDGWDHWIRWNYDADSRLHVTDPRP